ncbi:gamma-glutamyltransferase family protein [Frigidibacter sp. ROC022]|uniref:gamma-glutamyltransferase family protein n=1 Tax=Frigidibacter sp. ROC022 TaxID=2971796 RepID=UPI00215A5779|nr:gamma-glutamyltransferase family protein [Frigidibacter sp. ROC022]MCR8725771.1 gamma-glutamyltransferase family protein [Frigidibacter sp. ROC022]
MSGHMIRKQDRHQHWTLSKPAVLTEGGVVSAQSAIAAAAGARALAAGGNAVDAAVVTALALHVVEPWSSGLGGGGFLVLDLPGHGAGAVNFSMKAAADADPANYPLAGVPGRHGPFQWPMVADDRNTVGPHSILIPGAADGLAAALDHYGTLSWGDALEYVIPLAERGIPVGWYTTFAIAVEARQISQYPHTRDVFLRDGLFPPVSESDDASEVVRDPMMPGFLRQLQKNGARDFYEGEIGEAIVADMQAVGRNWTLDDLAAYRARVSAPDIKPYRDTELLGVPGLNGAPTVMRFFERVEHRFAPSGRPPTPADYAEFALLMRELWQERYSEMGDDNPNEKCTTHVSVVDRNGGMAALTNTMGARFGSKVSLQSSGLLMNNGMFWFDPEPGHANSIGPGKYPLTNACPMMVRRGRKPVLALGAAGGRRVPPSILQTISFVIDHGMSLEDAAHAPRIDPVRLEAVACDHRLSPEAVEAIAAVAPVRVVENTVYPFLFACISSVARDTEKGINCGMPSVDLPYAAAVSEAEV